MWIPTKEEAVEMYARFFEARHRSGAAPKARRIAVSLKDNNDDNGHIIWNDVATVIERIRHERVAPRRQLEMT